MPLHSNIKRRRQARIEQIKNQSSHSTPPNHLQRQRPVVPNRDEREAVKPNHNKPLPGIKSDDRPPKDPEEAWKRRMAEWSEQSMSELSGDIQSHSHEHSKRRNKLIFPAWGGFSLASLFVSLVIFMLLWGLYAVESPWSSRAQQAVTTFMNHSFSSEQTATWYREVFGGSPAWIPVIQRERNELQSQAVHSESLDELAPPVKGWIKEPFSGNGQGIHVLVTQVQQVKAALAGRVIFDGYTSSGRTIIIQHPKGVRTIYGWLDNVTVAENDWVEKGHLIAEQVQKNGDSDDRILYFSLRVGDDYVDPTTVVSFD